MSPIDLDPVAILGFTVRNLLDIRQLMNERGFDGVRDLTAYVRRWERTLGVTDKEGK